MNYEQKYKEALERARELSSKCKTNFDKRTMVYRLEDIEYIFPELKESEGEKIRKDILSFAKGMLKNNISEVQKGKFTSWIAWLEKQGEQKPQGKTALEAINEVKEDNANYIKVEPKFKED